MLKTDGAMSEMYKAMDHFFGLMNDADFNLHLDTVSQASGIHRYTVDMIYVLLCAKPLRYIYNSKGYGEEMFLETMVDTRYKLIECKKLHGIWGTFVISWYRNFFTLDRFKLGRLQFDRCKNYLGAHEGYLEAGETIISCHIPSSGPLDTEEAKESLRQVYRLHKDMAKDGKLKVVCHSWLLFTDLVNKLPENSNIRKFHDLFQIVHTHENPSNGDFWRIFYKQDREGITDEIVPEGSLQKTVLEHMKAGGTIGGGLGIIYVDENY
ncbi:MAG: hypothetical protein IJZ20_05550 [Clostridia bacterium]|nr:hypothetical protein [Clostridia bacterium]